MKSLVSESLCSSGGRQKKSINKTMYNITYYIVSDGVTIRKEINQEVV